MKPQTERYESPIASFVEGLNSAHPLADERGPAARLDAVGWTARTLKQVFALALVVLIVPMGTGTLFAQSTQAPPQQQEQPGPPPPPPTQAEINGQSTAPEAGPEAQPLSPDELDQMVAPIALYPDSLVAQILAAATYPTEVVEADRWVQAQGNAPAEQLASAANQQNWDPSVKALVAFPSVLAQMDKNIQWTTDLGNAYYNQPDDVMSAVQSMRTRAQAAGNLQNTPQQVVSDDGGDIVIAPSNPEVVYVPVYNPWGVYGAPFGVFPGYYYGPPPGVYFGAGLAIGFGVGIGIGVFSHWGWGYRHWGFNWRNRAVVYNRNVYRTRSRTVINRGYNRRDSPHGFAGQRGAYNRRVNNRGGAYNRGASSHGASNRGATTRGNAYNRSNAYNRGNANRGNAYNRSTSNRSNAYRGGEQNRGARPQANSRGERGHASAKPARSSGSGHPSGGHAGGNRGGGHPGGHPH